jgi:hypothetical protein
MVRGEQGLKVFACEATPSAGGRPAGQLVFVGPPLQRVFVNAENVGGFAGGEVVALGHSGNLLGFPAQCQPLWVSLWIAPVGALAKAGECHRLP